MNVFSTVQVPLYAREKLKGFRKYRRSFLWGSVSPAGGAGGGSPKEHCERNLKSIVPSRYVAPVPTERRRARATSVLATWSPM